MTWTFETRIRFFLMLFVVLAAPVGILAHRTGLGVPFTIATVVLMGISGVCWLCWPRRIAAWIARKTGRSGEPTSHDVLVARLGGAIHIMFAILVGGGFLVWNMTQ